MPAKRITRHAAEDDSLSDLCRAIKRATDKALKANGDSLLGLPDWCSDAQAFLFKWGGDH